ncbi:MAG TPA: hypothetical protein VHB98_16220, partial [Chloroflexota bacterium]|nr:hypothetical protein [Chloroflexota bacterium]
KRVHEMGEAYSSPWLKPGDSCDGSVEAVGRPRRPMAGATRRLYAVSRDLYAPVLAAFATEWLEGLVARPGTVAMCLGRDGIAAFVAARVLLRTRPERFHGVHPRQVRLAYISRGLANAAADDQGQATLLDRYLQAQGVRGTGALTVVDVGIHGSIQDALQRIYPSRPLHGHYLLLRRRAADRNGAAKRGFLAEVDVPPPAPLTVAPSWPPPPAWDLGGTLRRGDPLFLRRRSVHVLEDLWNGVGESAEAWRTSASATRVETVRRRAQTIVALPPGPLITSAEQVRLKRVALRGIADGVARTEPPTVERDYIGGLGEWLRGLEYPDPLDRYILTALVRSGWQTGAADELVAE